MKELVAGHPVHTHELVVSLRAFVREALDLDPIPADVTISMQGPTRPTGSSGAKNAAKEDAAGKSGGGGGGGGNLGGGGTGSGLGGVASGDDEIAHHPDPRA